MKEGEGVEGETWRRRRTVCLILINKPRGPRKTAGQVRAGEGGRWRAQGQGGQTQSTEVISGAREEKDNGALGQGTQRRQSLWMWAVPLRKCDSGARGLEEIDV